MPEISVIMGVHNGGPYLAEAVASIQSQTFSDWEMVLVENGSTDGAIDRLAATLRDPRIRIVRFDRPLSPGGSLRVACEQSTGAYLAVLDQDDIALPRRLELQKEFLDRVPDVSLLATAVEDIDEAGRPQGFEPLVGLHEDIHASLAYVHTLRHSSVMFRRTLLAQVSYRPELAGASDYDVFARASEVTRLATLPVVLCRYRIHATNETVRFGGRTAAGGGLARMLTRRRRAGLPEDFAAWTARFGALVRPDSTEASVHADCVAIFRRAGHHDLAALHAWMGWRTGGGWRAGLRYLGALGRGLARHRGNWLSLCRAWLKEPAHQFLRAGGMPDRLQF